MFLKFQVVWGLFYSATVHRMEDDVQFLCCFHTGSFLINDITFFVIVLYQQNILYSFTCETVEVL